MLPKFGYALVEEELSKRELDDEILSKENVILQQRMMTDESSHKIGSTGTKRKQLSQGSFNEDGSVDLNSSFLDYNNNNNDEYDIRNSLVRRNKGSLNVEEDPCPGLAMSEVTYKMD